MERVLSKVTSYGPLVQWRNLITKMKRKLEKLSLKKKTQA